MPSPVTSRKTGICSFHHLNPRLPQPISYSLGENSSCCNPFPPVLPTVWVLVQTLSICHQAHGNRILTCLPDSRLTLFNTASPFPEEKCLENTSLTISLSCENPSCKTHDNSILGIADKVLYALVPAAFLILPPPHSIHTLHSSLLQCACGGLLGKALDIFIFTIPLSAPDTSYVCNTL